MTVAPLERIRLTKRAAELKVALKAEREKEKPNSLAVLKMSNERLSIRRKLGLATAATQEPVDTARFYPTEQRRTKGQRQKDNDAAIALMAQIEQEGRAATDAEKATLARFSGYGGGLIDKDGLAGSPYEYYTPAPIAAGMWELVKEMGFAGGKALDPSAGSGVFAATRPQAAVIDQVELSEQSGGINKLVNDGATAKTTISPFEAVASRTPDESYDLVMTNVPFGGNDVRGATKMLDGKWQGESLEYYFMLRSMDKLKPNGLAAFIVPPRIVSGRASKDEELRYELSMRAEFMGAYRLPNRVFQDASDADTMVDVVVFRKHSRDAKQKINELAEQDIASLLAANVLWSEFIDGGYFRGEGVRFQLGEFQAKDPAKFRDVDRVISEQSTANIAKLLKKFPGSRIDWAALDATDSAPILYRDGDVIHQDGRTLEYRNGGWVARESTAHDPEVFQSGASLATPLSAINAAADWALAERYVRAMRETDRALDVPDWLTSVYDTLNRMKEGERAGWFKAFSAGLAVMEARSEHASGGPFNYVQAYPALSEALRGAASYASRSAGSLSQSLRDARASIGAAYSRRGGFAAWWQGEGERAVDIDLAPEKAYEKAKYEEGDDFGFVSRSRAAAIYGEDFDPMASDEWAISPDGSRVAKASDYYTGNFASYLKQHAADMAEATDPAIRDKLLRQREAAKAHLIVPDVSRMTFNLFSPFVPTSQKVDFLRSNIDPRFGMEFDDDGVPRIVVEIGSPKSENERQLKRFAEHLRVGTLTTRTSEADIALNPQLEAARIAQLRELVSSSNAKFNLWVKTSPEAFEAIRDRVEAPQNLYFRQVEDESELAIEGMNPELKLHGYQNAEVRRQGKRFGGINGMDVGLGKTFTSLASVQHAQSIGVKKKTFFVVPNSVLSNWRREATKAYASIDDCLFVGLNVADDGTASVNSSDYVRDFSRVLENRHSKVFMTLEAFNMIPLRDETLEAYGSYIASVDPSFSAAKGKEDEAKAKKTDKIRAEGKQAKLTNTGSKSGAVPFFEDMGVDSLVIDEAHALKNSKLLLEFQSAKYLSSASASERGLDAQVKAWYVRGQTPNRDGVLALTATPITNSPLEIYGMLSLAVGEEELNRRLLISGADDFMNAFTEVHHLEEPDLIGRPRAGRVFMGLQNVQLLRAALSQIANIKDKDDVGLAISVPDEEEIKTSVELGEQSRVRLSMYQSIYEAARAIMKGDDVLPDQQAMVERYSALTGEPVELLGHPFNFINKMSNLILDDDLDLERTTYKISASQVELAEKVVSQFNGKGYNEKRNRPSILTPAENVTIRKKKGGSDDEAKTETIIKVQGWVKDGQVVLDTTDYDTIDKFLALATKAKLNLDVTLSPKLAALVANFRKEQATPKAGSVAKQLVFCDMLGMHHKIKLALTQYCGVPANKIGIINAVAVSDPADMQELQDGFNEDGDGNRYEVVIANKKGEVGINLQRGTQAIHHLTIGWTPDSLTQRNGRGVRQGNYLKRVSVYHYDANGSFDEYKRTLVSKKDDWISGVMGKGGDADTVRVAGGMSEREMHDLIMASGDADAMMKARTQMERRERLRQTEAAREAQVQTLRIVKGQHAWLKQYPDAESWRIVKINEHVDLTNQAQSLAGKINRAKNEDVRARLERQQADVTARLQTVETLLRSSSGDYNGKPDGGLGYRIESYGRDKGMAKSTGRIVADSPLAQKYEAESAAVRASLEQARKEYALLAARPGGYSESTLAAFEAGEGAVVGGVLIMSGMVGRHKGKLWIATKNAAGATVLVLPATGDIKPAESAITGFEFIGPADADEDWLPIAEQCAAADELTIATNNDEGFNIGDTRLYSTYSADIAKRVKLVPKGISGSPRNILLRAPAFQIPVYPDTVGGELVKQIIASQVGKIEWRTVRQHGRDVEEVRVTDLAHADTSSRHGDMASALIRFAVSNGLRITGADVDALNISSFYTAVLSFSDTYRTGFEPALAKAVESASSADDIDAAMHAYIEASFPFLVFDGSTIRHADYLHGGFGTSMKNAKESMAVGGKPIIWFHEMSASSGPWPSLARIIGERIVANIDQYIVDGKSTIADESGGRAAMRALLIDPREVGIEGAYAVRDSLRANALEHYYRQKPDGALLLTREAGVEMLWGSFKYSGWEAAKKAANKAIAAAANAGVDIDGLIEAMKKAPGVWRAEVLSKVVSRPNKPWHGAYVYNPSEAIVIEGSKSSPLFERMSEKGGGLEGRYFERGTGWVFNLKSGEKDSKGSKVASAVEFLEFAGIDADAFKG